MRIVLVNWARIWDGAAVGGGVNGYCQALGVELARRGNEVVSLCGGTEYVPEPSSCFVRRHPDWLGIRVFEVINSPVLAPSILQFSDPDGEVSAPELEEQVGRLFRWIRPDAVHFHNIEGFSLGCVRCAREAGAKVVFSLHNYHTVCPQVYLMRGHRVPCTDADSGHNCVGCIESPDPGKERRKRAEEYAQKHVASPTQPTGEPTPVQREWTALRRDLGWPIGAAKSAWRLAKAMRARRAPRSGEAAVPPPGEPVENEQDAKKLLPLSGEDDRGTTRLLLAEINPAPPPDRSGPEYRALLNIAEPEPPSEKPLNRYGRRREAMVGMLNGCDRVLAVSEFVRRKFETLGVEPGVIRTLHIGTRMGRIIDRDGWLAFRPPAFDAANPRPVRVVFLGTNHHYKGLGMLAETLEQMATDETSRIDLSVYASGAETIEWMFRRLEPRLARLTFVAGYRFEDIPWICGGKDLGVVCSVWWDNAPQTVFEFLACGVPVLGAEVGGIPDFVEDGVNGLLFRANDRADLARRLGGVCRDPSVLDRLRANVRPPKRIEDHAAEMERVYRGEDIHEGGPGAAPGAGRLRGGAYTPRSASVRRREEERAT